MADGADSHRRDAAAGTGLLPVAGEITDGVHRLAVRVYFEDTDLSGVVYHANYLRFMERGRSDLLRLLGIDQRAAHEGGEGVYVVADLGIRYLRPARLNDALVVETRCLGLGAATVDMGQRVLRGDETLVEARVRAGFLTPGGRPRRQPADWMAKFRSMMPADS
jgi:acyl-CoA thioester hydrolase